MTNDERMSARDVRRRAAAAAATVGARGLVIRIVQFGGVIVLARMLTPHDFGLVAVGVTVVAFGSFLADFGIGAALIRRPHAPEPPILESLLGFQIVAAVVLALLTIAVVAPLGRDSLVTAVIVSSLPFLAARAPTGIVLERNLDYRPLVVGEIGETVAYYSFAITTAALGWGVWALAFAVVVRSVSGTSIILALAKTRVLRPALSWQAVRRLFSFGLQYQAVGVTNVFRDQGLNLGVAAIAGIEPLGIWTFANRILQAPFLLFGALWRVSFPAMSRLVALHEEPAPMVQRALSLTSVASGLMLVPLAGSAPILVPVVLGSQWQPVASMLPWPCLGLMVAGPISVAVAGYLYAIGDAATPLRAAVLHTATWLGLTLPLLPLVGVEAVAYGWLASSIVDAIVLGRGAARHAPLRIAPALVAPTAVAILSGACAWVIASSIAPSTANLIYVIALALALYVGGLVLVRRSVLVEMVGTTGTALKASVARA
jgi:polysaccharide transporter, PST family